MSEQSPRAIIDEQLRRLNVGAGDTIYLRCSLSRILGSGEFELQALLDSLMKHVALGGTIILPAFTKLSYRWRKPPIFSYSSPSTAGKLSQIIMSYRQSKRSSHPTHSFVALGPKSEEILEDHTRDKACFEPIRRLIELDAKMILAGCLGESPGFSTVHLAQHDLGLTSRHAMRLFLHAAEECEDGKIRRYYPYEDPGCSMGFAKLYQLYKDQGHFFEGQLGAAEAISVPAKEAYRIEKLKLKAEPTFALCSSAGCTRCRLLILYNFPPSTRTVAEYIRARFTKIRPTA